ncbi:hypothetical protein BKH41_09300 [Helicobacter sp. 12S02232-10]|uniref:terminase gpA endonuclease subunit n=1 Tax=Helicobacter sp. 12S02232-10 TaxID=1476197 RepID=UPI000BA56248|nr:terminase gpA endonuclease subunit [Helicobacter sp. 12S02232-10]PAF46293.1 hypothetical protein BKH41_09300 [Helicobacter sp. 12S02232-10]
MGILSSHFAKSIFIKPRLNLTEWSNTYRVLSKESSAMFGRFEALSYQIEPMNAISDPNKELIYARKENYTATTLPDAMMFIACAMDIQNDRIEMGFKEWRLNLLGAKLKKLDQRTLSDKKTIQGEE